MFFLVNMASGGLAGAGREILILVQLTRENSSAIDYFNRTISQPQLPFCRISPVLCIICIIQKRIIKHLIPYIARSTVNTHNQSINPRFPLRGLPSGLSEFYQ
jgi:hypothetical protein